MRSEKPSIPVWLHPLGYIECFQRLGVNPDLILSDLNLEALKDHSSKSKITLEQQHQLISSGIRRCGLSWPGVHVGLCMPWCFYGELAPIINCSPNTREAGAAFRRYTPIAQPQEKEFMTRIDYYLEDESTLFLPLSTPYINTVHPEIRDFDFQYRLAITVRLLHACGYIDKEFKGLELHLASTERIPAALVEQLGVTRVHYGAVLNGLSANHKFFIEDWRPFRKHLFDQAIANCERAYHSSGLDDSIKTLVRWHVDMCFIREVRLDEIADKLSITPRTLNRKLSEQGTSFRRIAHESRMNHAIRHVKYSKLSIAQLAHVLGYSSENSLSRAIKNWTSLSISELRRQTQYRSKHNNGKA